MAISRKDSFTIQVLQLSDALLVWGAFLIGGTVRNFVRQWAQMGVEEEKLAAMNWVLYIAVPFTPLFLERFGFYEHLKHKTAGSAVWQLIRALVTIILFIGVFAVFAQIADARRLSLSLGLLFVFVLLLLRDRATHSWLMRRTESDATKERVVIAGSDGEMAELIADLDRPLEGTLTVSQQALIDLQQSMKAIK